MNQNGSDVERGRSALLYKAWEKMLDEAGNVLTAEQKKAVRAYIHERKQNGASENVAIVLKTGLIAPKKAEKADFPIASKDFNAAAMAKLLGNESGLFFFEYAAMDKPAPEAVSWKQIAENKKAKVGRRHVFLRVQSKRPHFLEKAVRRALGKNGYTFTDRDAAVSEIVAVLEAEPVEMSLMKEAVKYDFFFSLRAPDISGNSTEVLNFSFEEVGLNEGQAFSRAAETVQDRLEKHLNEIPF